MEKIETLDHTGRRAVRRRRSAAERVAKVRQKEGIMLQVAFLFELGNRAGVCITAVGIGPAAAGAAVGCGGCRA